MVDVPLVAKIGLAESRATGESVKFATNVYLHFAFSYFTRNTDNLIVGWRYSAGALGLLQESLRPVRSPESQLLAPISAVVVATLSRLSRERKQYQRYFLAGNFGFGIRGNGDWNRLHARWQGSHSVPFGSGLGGGWPHLRLVWPGRRDHAAL